MLQGQNNRSQSAFSLVETVIAVGITATVIMTLLALLPIGLDKLRSASLTTSEAQIRQTVVSNYKMLDWDEVEDQATSGIGRDFYFDEQGAPVPQSDENMLYGARVWVGENIKLSGDVLENEFLRQLTIHITDRPDIEDAYTDPDKYRITQATISKIEK